MPSFGGPLRINIRPTVVAVFLLATLLTAALAIGLQYYFAQSMARESSTRLYQAASTAVAAELANLAKVNNNVISLLAANPLFDQDNQRQAQLQVFASVLTRNPLYYGIYLGRGDGSFFEVINLETSEFARKTLDALPSDRWVVVTVQGFGGGITRTFRYMDAALQVRTERSEQTRFQATARQWYQTAMESGEVVATEPYRFAQLGVPGLTLSQRIAATPTVVGIDMTLSSIARLLQSAGAASQSEIYLYDSSGNILASSLLPPTAEKQAEVAVTDESTTGGIPDELMLALAADTALHGKMVESESNGAQWLVYVARTSSLHSRPLYIGIRAKEADVMAHFMEEVKLSTVITAGFLLLLLPFSWFFANPIVYPIRQLARENDKVRRREYDQVRRVPSHVKELDELSESMLAMVDAIRAHELAQRQLMDSFIQLIAQAIDDKSPYTGGHCARVPELAMMLARAASEADTPPFDKFKLRSDDEWREYHIAAWLHDCGKITTPEHIVDKGSKLEVIYNRIHEVRMRFEVLWRDARIEYLEAVAAAPGNRDSLEVQLGAKHRKLQDDFRFVALCNVGGECLDETSQARLKELADITWQRHFDDRLGLSPTEALRSPPGEATLPATERLLADKPEHVVPRSGERAFPPELGINMQVPEHLQNMGEVYNLSISRGTLTPEDRFRIQEHMISTIKMLESLPFPPELQNVPRYATTHHETLDGAGYPRRLNGEQLGIAERILAIADIFEALTAADRPYKEPKTVSEALAILNRMATDRHIDRDCLELFVRQKVYLEYARSFLRPEQIDEVDVKEYMS